MSHKFRILTLTLLSTALTFSLSAHGVDSQPRRIVTGWIPYYSVKTVIPFIKKLPTSVVATPGAPVTCEANEYSPEDIVALNASYLFTNKDLMKEIMPFWYTLKSPTIIRNDYVTGNPSWPM
jgi:hypothetical protein